MSNLKNEWRKQWEKTDFDEEYEEIEFEPFKKFFKKFFKRGDKILEAGCGQGRYCLWLKKNGMQTYGIDIVPKAIEIAKRKCKGVSFFVGDVCNLPFKDKQFAGYVSLGVVEHFNKRILFNKCFREAYRVLKPGGYAFLAVPNPNSFLRLYVRLRVFLGSVENVRHYPIFEKDLLAAGKRAGFRLVEIKYREFYYPFYLLIKRLFGEIRFLRRILRNVLNLFDFVPFLNKFSPGICVVFRKPL